MANSFKVITSLRTLLLLCEVLVGIAAVAGAYGLLTNILPFDTSVLKETPFSSFTLPAVFLFSSVGIPMLYASFLVYRHPHLGEVFSEFSGLMLLVWITMEFLIIGQVTWFQPLLFLLGITIVVLAAELHEFDVRR